MPTPTPCPDDHILRLFLVHYGIQQGESLLEAHLLECTKCAERVDALVDDDLLVKVMRGARPLPLSEADAVRVEEAIARLTKPVASSPEVTTPPTPRPAAAGENGFTHASNPAPTPTHRFGWRTAMILVGGGLILGLMMWTRGCVRLPTP